MSTKHFTQVLVFAAAALSALPALAFAPVDTDAQGEQLRGEHFLADVSANGRYVLLTNFDAADGMENLGDKRCRVLRKDRLTGEIVTVFRSNDKFDYCAAVRISANGRYVAAAPGQPLGDTDICEAPGARVQALQVKDVTTGDVRRVWKRWQAQSANDCARIPLGTGGSGAYYPPREVYAYSGNGNVAVTRELGVYGNTVGFAFELYDAETGESRVLSPDGTDTPAVSSITSLAISHQGSRIAMAVPDPITLGPGDFLTCGQTGRCDLRGAGLSLQDGGASGGYNQYNKQVVSVFDGTVPNTADDCGSWWQCPQPALGPAVSIRILNREQGTVRKPPALRGLSKNTSLESGGWSLNGKRLSWIEYPDRAVGKCYSSSIDGPTLCEFAGCADDECELSAQTYWLSAKRLRSKKTQFDADSLSACFEAASGPAGGTFVSPGVDCSAKLSRNGNFLLYPRAVRYPFGGDWQPDSLAIKDFVCVDRVSLDTPGFEPEEVECPDVYPDSGPILGIHPWDTQTDFASPVI